jgi:hypothetical protein
MEYAIDKIENRLLSCNLTFNVWWHACVFKFGSHVLNGFDGNKLHSRCVLVKRVTIYAAAHPNIIICSQFSMLFR